MHSNILSSLGLLAALTVPTVAQKAAYFVMGSGMPVIIERADPLLSPGKPSGHVHSVVGGNGFSTSMDFAKTQESTCSTIRVKFDKSNYWMPALYFHAKNGSFIRVPEKPDHRLYYKYGNNDGTPDREISEFPPGFRMITGDANLRSDDGSFGSGGNQLNWVCHDGGSNPRAVGFPTGFTNCDGYGLAASMRFPSCWNGADFDPANPLAHMAFPTNRDGLAGCPAPFNFKRFAEIFSEYYLTTTAFNGLYERGEQPFVLAQGDPTGYGFHMDFLNGWEVGKLAQAMKGCDSGNTGQGLDVPQCFGPGSLQDNNVADNCRATREIDEDVGLVDQLAADHGNTLGGVLSALPGCNPIQPGPGKATKQTCGGIVAPPVAIPAPVTKPKATSVSPVANTTPAAASKKPTSTAAAQKPTSAATSPSQAPSTGGTAAGVTIPVGWNYLGCYSDNLNPRSLGKQGVWYGQPITSSNCIAHCKSIGMTLAGTENGGQCFCGNELKQSKPTPGKCTTPCSANTHEMCGGSGTLSVFKSSGKSKPRHRHRRSAHGFAIAS